MKQLCKCWGGVIVSIILMLAFFTVGCDVEGDDGETPSPTSYTITIAEGIEHGSVSASPTTAAAGASITLTVTPAEGYELDALSVKDAKNADVKVTKDTNDTSKYTFTMPESNVTVSATFDKTLPPVYNPTPLTLEALTAGTIVVDKPQEGMQYSLNDGAKTTMNGKTTITVAKGDKVAFYGKGTSIKCYYSEHEELIVVNDEYGYEHSYTDTIQDNTAIAGGTAEVKVFGNILSLLDETDFATATEITAENAFRNLFKENTKLKDASELILPATKLSKGCYQSMFRGCSSLTKVPALPATKLSESCYQSMFNGCSSLTKVPELPATKLSEACYSNMFNGCSSLTTAPELPASTLTEDCYAYMFRNCTSLTTAPELPANTLAYNCYGDMFSGCSSLTTAPKLPATTLAEGCYQWMFKDCTGLTVAPEISATKVAKECCQYMFQNCSKLTTGPEILPATTLEASCYLLMFVDCTSLTKAPKLPATTLANSCYSSMFDGCSSLTKAPDLPATKLVKYCYARMFSGCSSLTEVTCLATDISAEKCTEEWFYEASSSGTFTTPSSTNWGTGVDGIPSGWTRVDAN